MDESGLTFDWDDRDLQDPLVATALEELGRRFGPHHIWIRTSSSGEGLHVMIGSMQYRSSQGRVRLRPMPMLPAQQFALRQEFGQEPWVDQQGPLECPGRLISDSLRGPAGFRTSRVFGIKSTPEGEPLVAQEWKPYAP